jgi:hypothetical protein
VEQWFYIYSNSYSTKTTEKLLLILEFHTPSSPWHLADVATTSHQSVQQYAWRHWDSAMTLTQQRKSVYHICYIWYFYTTPDTTARLPDSTGKILLVFYEIYRVGDSARSRINYARKCAYAKVILTRCICSDFANSEFVRWKSLIFALDKDQNQMGFVWHPLIW